jgi:L-malate glycosyltransferase
LKILLFISHSSNLTGGGEDDFAKLLKYFSNKYVIYTIFPSGKRCEEYIKYSTKYLKVKGSVFPFTKFSLKAYIGFFYRNFNKIFAIYNFIRKNGKIDLCYLNSSVCFIDAIPVVLLKIPYILSVKEKINPKIISNIIFYFYKKTAAKILTISEFLKNEITIRTKRSDIGVIYSTIEEEYFENVINKKKLNKDRKKDNSFKILNIGSIYPLKGQHVLAEVLIKMNDKNISVELIGSIINCKYYSKIFNFIKINNLSDRFKYVGELNKFDLINKILDSDCIVITSKEEGQSLVILESLFLEKPIISTKVGVSTEIIENKINGILYDYGDIDCLCESIEKLKNDKELYLKILENCKSTYSKYFNSRITMLNYESIFKEFFN